MGMIKRKMVVRDLLKQVDASSVKEVCRHLGISLATPLDTSLEYSLIQRTLHALVDDGIVSKLRYGNQVKYELRYRNRETSTREEILFQRWEEVLADKHGWHTFDDLQRITGSVATTAVNRRFITAFIDYVNDRNRITIRAKDDPSSNQRYFIDGDTEDRYADLKEKIPVHPAIVDEAVRTGHRPSVAAAAVEWLETDTTQKKMAEKYDVSDVGIRRNTDWVKEWIETRQDRAEANPQ